MWHGLRGGKEGVVPGRSSSSCKGSRWQSMVGLGKESVGMTGRRVLGSDEAQGGRQASPGGASLMSPLGFVREHRGLLEGSEQAKTGWGV